MVVIGGGFGGLNTVKNLRKSNVRITLVDRHNYHLFQPLLYQVATAGLSPSDIASPIRGILSKQKNVNVMLGEVDRIDRHKRQIHLKQDVTLEYDYLVIAAGMRNNYFGHDHWANQAPGLKSIDEALMLRRRMLLSFEGAEYAHDPEDKLALLSFVIVGAGPTGVEMAGAISEIATEFIATDFRHIKPQDMRIVLIEGQDRVLSMLSPESSQNAQQELEKRGIEVVLGTIVKEIDHTGVRTDQGTWYKAKNVIWAAGLKSEALTDSLAELERDRTGRIKVNALLQPPLDDRIYAIGDIAHFVPEGKEFPLPGLAPVAIQQGKRTGKNLAARLAGRGQEAFEYFDKGTMATIGRASAVAETKGLKLRGFIAWVAWLFIHLLYLVGFRSKVSVLVNWVYSYVAFRQATRIITGDVPSRLGANIMDDDDGVFAELHQEPGEFEGEELHA